MSTKKLNKRQEAILDYIERRNRPSSVGDILLFVQKEEENISRITVIRDLSHLLKEQLLIREGAGRAVKYRVSPQYGLLKEIKVEKYFNTPQDDRVIKKHFNYDVFTLLGNPIFTQAEQQKLHGLHKEFRTHLCTISSALLVKKEFERIMIEFSWKSSQIEGNTYSLLDTEALIKNNLRAEGKTKEESNMILNHKKAFQFIMEHRDEFTLLSRAKIEHIHALLIKDLQITPNLRRSPVGIIGTNYKPLDNQFQIAEAFEKMIRLINAKADFIEKSFLSLLLLSYIQAFEDANKRTARTISNAILLAFESIPMSYRAVSEIEYKKASILFYEQNNVSYFKQVFISQYEFAVKNYFL